MNLDSTHSPSSWPFWCTPYSPGCFRRFPAATHFCRTLRRSAFAETSSLLSFVPMESPFYSRQN